MHAWFVFTGGMWNMLFLPVFWCACSVVCLSTVARGVGSITGSSSRSLPGWWVGARHAGRSTGELPPTNQPTNQPRFASKCEPVCRHCYVWWWCWWWWFVMKIVPVAIHCGVNSCTRSYHATIQRCITHMSTTKTLMRLKQQIIGAKTLCQRALLVCRACLPRSRRVVATWLPQINKIAILCNHNLQCDDDDDDCHDGGKLEQLISLSQQQHHVTSHMGDELCFTVGPGRRWRWDAILPWGGAAVFESASV